MKMGVCSTDFQTMPAKALFEAIHQYGFACVQLAVSSFAEAGFVSGKSIEIPERLPAGALSAAWQAAQRFGIQIAAVNGTFNMAHPDAQVRMEGVRRFEPLVHKVKDQGCRMVTLCTGTRNPEYLWAPHPENESEGAWADMRDTMARLVDIAHKHEVTLAIETEASNVVNTPERARRILDEMGSPFLKMIIDCANLFHIGRAHPENVRPTIQNAFDHFGKDIVLAHGKDIRAGEGISYCAAGQGIVDFPHFIKLLREYQYPGEMMLHGAEDMAQMDGAVRFMRGVLAQ